MFRFSNPTTDLIVVLLIVLLIFGPKRLPGLGRQLGQGLREFKDSITGNSKDSEGGEHPQITQASAGSTQEVGSSEVASDRQSAEVASSEPRS
jgi:sec-independent protein translocase protein TatA